MARFLVGRIWNQSQEILIWRTEHRSMTCFSGRVLQPRKLRNDNGKTGIWRCISYKKLKMVVIPLSGEYVCCFLFSNVCHGRTAGEEAAMLEKDQSEASPVEARHFLQVGHLKWWFSYGVFNQNAFNLRNLQQDPVNGPLNLSIS